MISAKARLPWVSRGARRYVERNHRRERRKETDGCDPGKHQAGRATALDAHMIRTVERYLSRLGSQFAAATTYFSVLAIVPIMMVAFSITGFRAHRRATWTLRRCRGCRRGCARQRGPGHPREDLATRERSSQFVLDHRHRRPRGRSLPPAPNGWPLEECRADPVATGIRPSTREDQHCAQDADQPPDLGWLHGWYGLSFGLASLSTSFEEHGGQVARAQRSTLDSAAASDQSIAFSIGAGWLIFMYLYTVLRRRVSRGACAPRGTVGFDCTCGFAVCRGFPDHAFRGNLAASVFGPVIVVMLFFNIFAAADLVRRGVDRHRAASGRPGAS